MDAQLSAMLEKLDDNKEFTLVDLMVIINILKNDVMLNKWAARWATSEEKETIDAFEDILVEVEGQTVEYDYTNLNAIQGLMQNSNHLADVIITAMHYGRGDVTPFQYIVDYNALMELKEVGVDVSIRFDTYDEDENDENDTLAGQLYPIVSYEFENFYLEN